MKRLEAASAGLLTAVLTHPAAASAASNTATTSIPVDPTNTIEMHVTVNCASGEQALLQHHREPADT